MVSFQHNAIIIYTKTQRVSAELTYFLLPSHNWLLEQIFASSETNRRKYQKILIQEFFERIPQRLHCVRILDPFAKSYLHKHPEYQKYLHEI